MKRQTNKYYLEAVNRAIEFIELNMNKNISLTDISAYAYLSKYHFHRIFKSIVGDTTKDYLVRLRLEKSAYLLKNTLQPINKIAYDCGYTSPENFTRSFKNYFSVTPNQFRDISKQEMEQKRVIHQQHSLASLNISAPQLVKMDDLNLAYIRHIGGYEEMNHSFERLTLWAAENNILINTPTMGVLYDTYGITEKAKIRFDACILVKKEITPEEEIGYKYLKGGKYAVFRYTGPYEAFYEVYDYIYDACIFDFKFRLRDEPVLEKYITSPPQYKPHELITDVYMPVV